MERYVYGCEAWTIGKGERRSEAFEMWCYRKLLKTNWLDKVTNDTILNLVKEKRSLYVSIKRRRDRLIGDTIRHKGLAEIVLQGILEGRKKKGKQRLEYVKKII